MAANMESLRPNRSLLNAKFDGYKLSPDPLEVQTTCLAAAVNIVSLKDDVCSHLHVKAFGWTNHLVLDNWNEEDTRALLYFVDENFSINQVTVKDKHVEALCSVYQILPAEQKALHQLNAFVSFPSDSHAIATDGAGQLYILHTGNRLEQVEWDVTLVHKLDKPFSILHSYFEPISKTLSCLLLSVTTDETDSIHVKHTVVLTLLVFSAEVGEKGGLNFIFEVQKEFQSCSVPLYAAIEPSNKAILLASERPFFLDGDQVSLEQGYDDIKPTLKQPNEETKPKKEYVWTQDREQITIFYPLPEGIGKHDILFAVKTHGLKVSLKNGQVMMDGELFAPVESDSCTWLIDDNRLQISLEKAISDHLWLDVIKGDERGDYRPNGDNLDTDELVNARDSAESEKVKLFNQGELEECDTSPEDILYIVRMDIKDGTVTHKTSLSTHQWLFTKVIKPTEPPVFCVRHDVDALVWQPHVHEEPGEENWTHVGTLNAFGYVQASKKDQKFTTCSADTSYSVICDVRNHIFTYYQPGDKDPIHAKQKVIQLDEVGSDGIVGIQACNKMIFALANNKLFLVSAF